MNTDFSSPQEGAPKIVFPSFPVPDFHGNLVYEYSNSAIQKVASYLRSAIKEDETSIKDWKNAVEKGIECITLCQEDSSLQDRTLSRIQSSAMTRCMVEFNANFMAEFFPPGGPVRGEVSAKPESKELLELADQKEARFNHYLMKELPEYYPERERLANWCALAGSVFTSVYKDPISGKVKSDLITPSSFIINQSTTSIESCQRFTQLITYTEKEMMTFRQMGVYNPNISISADSSYYQDDSLNVAALRSTGLEPTSTSSYNKIYRVAKCSADLNLRAFGIEDPFAGPMDIPAPYLVYLANDYSQVIGIYRDWDQNDVFLNRLSNIIHWGWVPSLNFLYYGLAHICSNDSIAASQSLRMIMDAAVKSNFPGGIIDKGLRLPENNLTPAPGEFVPVNSPGMPLSDLIEPFPYKEPSPALVQLKQDFEDSINKMNSSANMEISDLKSNVPASSVLMVLEQANRLQTGIMRRLYRSAESEFANFDRLLSPELGFPADGKVQIVPVTDPHVTSRIQRILQSEAALSIANQSPDGHNIKKMQERVYRAMNISNISDFLDMNEEPVSTLPDLENSYFLSGMPLRVKDEQDHDAHELVHSYFLENLKKEIQSQIRQPMELSPLEAHILQHRAKKATMMVLTQAGIAPKQMEQEQELPIEIENAVAQAEAQLVQQQQEMEAQNQPPPPIDPALPFLKEVEVKGEQVRVKEKEIEIKAENDRIKIEQQSSKLSADQQTQALKNQLEVQKAQADLEAENFRLEMEKQKFNLEREKAEFEAVKQAKELEIKKFEAQIKEKNAELQQQQVQVERMKLTLDQHSKNEDRKLASIPGNEKTKK